MTKKRIAMPGIRMVERGAIRIRTFDQVFDERDFKVWEFTTDAKYIDASTMSGTDGYTVVLSDYDYTLYRKTRKNGWATILYLDLDDTSRHWYVTVSGGKDMYTIIAYAHPFNRAL